MMNKNQMHYIEKADEAEKKGMFREAIEYYRIAEDYFDVNRVKRSFGRVSKGISRGLGVERYLREKREDRIPADIKQDIGGSFGFDYIIQNKFENN